MKEKFVVLLRHGIAEPHGSRPDEERELTDEGRRKVKEIAVKLTEIFPDVDTIISSPLVRAVRRREQSRVNRCHHAVEVGGERAQRHQGVHVGAASQAVAEGGCGHRTT